MYEDDFTVIQAMKTYGGSFVKALAEAARLADSINLEKIKTAFSDYWEKYRGMSEKKD
jgi:hypothetical protein